MLLVEQPVAAQIYVCVEYGQVSKIMNFNVQGFDLPWSPLIPLLQLVITGSDSGILGGGFKPPKFWRPSKIVPNSTWLWKLLKIAEFRTPAPQDVRKKGSKILKLLPVHNCFTLATTNKLVVIINSLKVPKIKKIWLYEMKFLVPNYSCLQNPWLGGYRPQIPVLCPQLNLLNTLPHEQNSWVRHCWYMSLYVGDRVVCWFRWNCIPHGHLHTVTHTRGRIDTTDSPDDKHFVARNM